MQNILKTSILALAGLALTVPAAKALTANDGDLFLAVRSTTGGTSYLLDLGAATKFITGGVDATGSIVTLTNINTDLLSLSSTYSTDSSLLFSVAGVNKNFVSGGFGSNTLFASAYEPSGAPGTQSTPWSRDTTGNQSLPANALVNQRNAYAAGTAANNPAGLLQANTATNSYRSYQPGGSNSDATDAYTYWGGGIESGLSVDSAVAENGALGAPVVDLYQLNVDSSGNQGDGQLLGAFRVTSTGAVQFDSNISGFAAVPEPATAVFGLLGVATCALGRFRTRRLAVA